MKRLLVLIIVVGLGFYAGWPAWSGYQIKSALDRGDTETLRQKIDFSNVRVSLKPAAEHYAEQMLQEKLQSPGSPVSTVLTNQAKASLLKTLVDQTLTRLVTPETLIRLSRQGGTLKDAVAKLIKQETSGSAGGLEALGNLGKVRIGDEDGSGGRELDIGGLVGGIVSAARGGKPISIDASGDRVAANENRYVQGDEATASVVQEKVEKIGIGNIKHVGFDGPLGIKLGIARDARSKKPDLIAGLRFQDMDWKLVSLEPQY